MGYQTVVQRWHDFYIVAGTAAATLVGLLFVGLSLHLRVVLSRPEVRSLARVTLSNFGLLLLISLFVTIPQGRSAAAIELVSSGIIGIGLMVPHVLAAARSPTRTLRFYQLLMRFGLSLVCSAGVAVAGRFLGRGTNATAFNVLVIVTVVLLIVSLRNSWDLLVSVGAGSAEDYPRG